MKHKILYTSDLHGNELQYKKLVDYSIKISADSIVIGGDIAPKNFQPKQFVDGQRYFLQEKLPGLLSPLKKSLPNSRLFLMMGNDDCKINLDVLERENNTLYQIIHKKRVPLTDDFDIVGYSYVPITPFGIKDWEKFDLSDVPSSLLVDYQHRKMTNYRLEGFKTTSLGWEPFQFNQDSEKSDSIQKDLSGALFRIKADRTLYVIHTPPNHTSLDMEMGGDHVGSFAVRLFIEDVQPYLALHGHIHETVDVSGNFKQQIGDTLCLSSGNHNEGKKLTVLVFDLYDPKQARRILL